MARRRRRGGQESGSTVVTVGRWAGKILTGVAWVSLGVCVGIVLGSVMDGPRLFVRRLTEPIQRIDMTRAPIEDRDQLTAFRELSANPKVARAEAPETVAEPEPEKSEPKKPEPEPARVAAAPAKPAPKPTAPVAAPPPAPVTREQGAADKVLADLRSKEAKAKQGSPPPPDVAAAPGSRVIQVAAYTDKRAAGALATRLTNQGFDSYVSHTEQGGKDRYRVRVKPGSDVKGVSQRLKKQGLSVWVTTE